MSKNYISILDNSNDLKFFTFENEDSLKILISSSILKKSNPINIDNPEINDDNNNESMQMNTYKLNKLIFKENMDEIIDLLAEYKIILVEDV